jgi:hypothetical protein
LWLATSQRAADDEPSGRPNVRSLRSPQSLRLVIGDGHGNRPNLFVNPLSDAAFAQQTADLVTDGTARPEELADKLRDAYPDVVARKREISGEAESWYVYRDGHWVDDDSS